MNRLFEIIIGQRISSFSQKDLPLRIGGAGSHIPIPGFRQDICLIGEIDGYLFLQPISSEIRVLHNHEIIEGSCWIKSGDQTRIGKYAIFYVISGDIVDITVEKTASPKIEGSQLIREETHESPNPLPMTSGDEIGKQRSPTWIKISLPLLVILTCVALFLLSCISIGIDVSPTPESLSVSGLFPSIKIGKRFLILPGRYTVTAMKTGYRKLQVEITPSKHKRSFTFSLAPLPGIVDLTTSPEAGASIMLDGKHLGPTPIREMEIEAGNHTILVIKERYRKAKQDIVVEGKGLHQYFDFRLEPAWGTIHLTSRPPGAEILVDGQETGQKTPASLELSEGIRRLTLRLSGFLPWQKDVRVQSGLEIKPETAILQRPPALIQLKSIPKGAIVTVDGVFRGKAPLRLRLSSNRSHKITATALGHKSVTKKIRPEAGSTTDLTLRLTPQFCTVFISSPANTALFIDGMIQKKNTGRFRLSAMPHILEIRTSGGDKQQRKITPLPGSTLKIDMRIKTSKREIPPRLHTSQGHILILIKPCTFTMGSSRREAGRRTNEIKRRVRLTRPFYISAHEVTNAQYRRFEKDHSSGSFKGINLDGSNQPVVQVSWADAVRYLNWLSIREGIEPFYKITAGQIEVVHPLTNGYRLPTEAEWACAARFAKRTRASKYPWPGTFPPPDRSGNFADESARGILPVIMRGYNDGFPVSGPVGNFQANPAGLFDIGGNVSEWCHDLYSPVVLLRPGLEQDPLGPSVGTHHVVRGASWKDSSVTELRLSYRGYSRKPEDDLGFRIARYVK